MTFNTKRLGIAALAAVVLVGGCGFHRKKYENPITKDTEQPDKVLFDKAIKDIEKGRYEVARLTLNTLINTYDSSEFLAKAKLAIADSWMRQSGPEGMAQAEAEYKDFQLFYPTMEEAPEAQSKICEIHIRQMEKADRDPNNALRAEQECRDLLTKYPNSKFAPQTEQRLREIQEALARVRNGGRRLLQQQGSARRRHQPLYRLGGAISAVQPRGRSAVDGRQRLHQMGARFRQKAGDAYTRIVRDYPLSPYAELAKKKLQEMELPVPEADPAAVARMKYEAANHVEPGTLPQAHRFYAAQSGRERCRQERRAHHGSSQARNSGERPEYRRRAAPGFTGDVTVAPVTGAFRARYTAGRASRAPAGSGALRGQHEEKAIALS